MKVGESIGMLFTINKYQEAARATREAARALGLTRPFPVVDQILNSLADKTGFRSLPLNQVSSSVADPDPIPKPDPPDPRVFGPPGSGSTSQRY